MFNKLFKAILPVTLLLLATVINAAQTVTYFHNDISGTPLMATDASGNVVWKENYYPYGERLKNQEGQQVASINNKLWFTGKPHDEDTGLSYFGARYYNPMLGRFMGVDPVDFNPDNIHSFNRYAYANNNPFKFIDPDGKNPLNIFDYYHFAKDVGNLIVKEIVYGIAIANGEYGVANQISQELGGAAVAAAESTIGLISFVPGTTQILRAQRIAKVTKGATKGDNIFGEARFVADSKGNIVDLQSTPKGRYTQPGGEKTDILQKHEHPGYGFSHTHIPGSKTTPKKIRSVSTEDVKNITSGKAVFKQKK